ncbi:MAG TPA: phosphoribosylglycinamide synthetase C domain-containing protein [Xanthobacteraceae bacterium]|nr:phosphoribosylglycinamide synthetase C domain-containing protein [Xanthobacteraceae bacterium]
MRFLGIGDFCDLASLYLRLQEEGHEVKVHIANALCRQTLLGLVPHVDDWRTEIPWIRQAGPNGIVLFENAAEQRGALQDTMRRDGLHVIGGSAYGDRLENDRAYAQEVLRGLGLPICPVVEFSAPAAALAFLDRGPGRYVVKFNGPLESFVGTLPDGRDVRAFVNGLREDTPSFILMRHVEGVEMGVGAYFNGERFLSPSCLDWEHKRFFPGDLGEMTAEMGTIVTYENTARFHERTLAAMAPLLQAGGYCGYINLNTIVNEQGIWPLEFTCRFGYPGYAILDPLQETPWGELFHAMVTRSGEALRTRPGFAAGIVMTTPPFPYSRSVVAEPIGMPIVFDGIDDDEHRHLHYGEVGLEDGQLVTSGGYGWTMVVTGVGDTVRAARDRANRLAERVIIPNARYRRDIGERLMAGDLDRLKRLGMF